MTNKNIKYGSKAIVDFFSNRRRKWNDFYPSEKWVFEKVANEKDGLGEILDVGCACGGLGRALSERFKLASYTGVDICKEAIEWARRKQKFSLPTSFIAGDIVNLRLTRQYDTVVSLSCADWNIQTNKIIDACWRRTAKGGYFIISLRLTPKKGINNISKSYQYISCSKDKRGSGIANYVVFNFKEAIKLISGLSPSPGFIGAYGYWGKPSPTAVTPFAKLIFTVFYIKKCFNPLLKIPGFQTGDRNLQNGFCFGERASPFRPGGSTNSKSDLKTEFNLPIECFY